ncbi:MAG: hypothetical protein ACFFDW_06600 [Candidatus Thorarchaeota archaeon]
MDLIRKSKTALSWSLYYSTDYSLLGRCDQRKKIGVQDILRYTKEKKLLLLLLGGVVISSQDYGIPLVAAKQFSILAGMIIIQ